jgi:hypothetical protein
MEEFRGKRISGTIISFDNSRLFRMPRRGDIVEAVFVRGELVEVCAKD